MYNYCNMYNIMIYFSNIHMKHLQRTSETSETIETYSFRPEKNAILAQCHGFVSSVRSIIDKKVLIFIILNKYH
jgi:hypothetical protein